MWMLPQIMPLPWVILLVLSLSMFYSIGQLLKYFKSGSSLSMPTKELNSMTINKLW